MPGEFQQFQQFQQGAGHHPGGLRRGRVRRAGIRPPGEQDDRAATGVSGQVGEELGAFRDGAGEGLQQGDAPGDERAVVDRLHEQVQGAAVGFPPAGDLRRGAGVRVVLVSRS
jgi:hypothetical protein